jgi:hypothetical protein
MPTKLIETLQSLSRPNTKEPRGLVEDVGAEYLFPIVPPLTATLFNTTIGGTTVTGRRSTNYAEIFYKIDFGFLVPGVFRLSIFAGGVEAYNGTLQGNILQHGIDYLYFLTPEKSLTVYITNLTNLNQTFEMTSRFLAIANSEDWAEIKKQIKLLNFPYKFPEEIQ